MADIAVTAADARPLEGAVIRRGTAGGSGNVGDLVYLASDGDWEQADADALASSQARGVVVAVNSQPGTTFVAGDRLDIVRWGPVRWGASMTIAGRVYVSTTAGKGDQTAPAAAGDYPFMVGYAEAANILFVEPQTSIPTVNS